MKKVTFVASMVVGAEEDGTVLGQVKGEPLILVIPGDEDYKTLAALFDIEEVKPDGKIR